MTTNNKIIVNTKSRVPFGVWIRVGPRNHAVGGNQQDPSCRNANLRDISRPIAKYGEPAACADRGIDVPFEMRTRERPRNHVFDLFTLAPSGEYVRSILGRQRWANCARTDRDGFLEALTLRKLRKRCTGWGRGGGGLHIGGADWRIRWIGRHVPAVYGRAVSRDRSNDRIRTDGRTGAEIPRQVRDECTPHRDSSPALERTGRQRTVGVRPGRCRNPDILALRPASCYVSSRDRDRGHSVENEYEISRLRRAPPPCHVTRCRILEAFDHAIFAFFALEHLGRSRRGQAAEWAWFFFALEMLVKITAMGLVGRHTYLADTWNRLDFFIVVAGYVTTA